MTANPTGFLSDVDVSPGEQKGARQHEGDWRTPWADHDHSVPKNTRSNDVVFFFSRLSMGRGWCFLFFSVLILKLRRKEIAVVLTIVITVPFFCCCTGVLVGTFGILSPSR